jgi:acetyltransferase
MLKDTAMALPPLTGTLARRMMMKTRIYRALRGVRGAAPVDVAAIEQMLVRFGQMLVEQPWIAECDINPLLVSSERILALDARIVLHDPTTDVNSLPRPAIRPYPSQYGKVFRLENGLEVNVRLIRPEDELAMVDFHRDLSERTVRMRYFHTMQYAQRTTHERLVRICFADYERDLPLVAELTQPNEKGERSIVAVGRLSKLLTGNRGEFALLVSDRYQGVGLGTELLRTIVDIARKEGLDSVYADILPDNLEMQKVASRVGFNLDRRIEEQRVVAEIILDQNPREPLSTGPAISASLRQTPTRD